MAVAAAAMVASVAAALAAMELVRLVPWALVVFQPLLPTAALLDRQAVLVLATQFLAVVVQVGVLRH
jgi:hypothetical protein